MIVDNPNNLGGDPNIDDLTAEKPHKFVTIYAADTMRQLPHLGANICVPTGAIVK